MTHQRTLTAAHWGVYEVEYGYPLDKFIYEDCGGVLVELVEPATGGAH